MQELIEKAWDDRSMLADKEVMLAIEAVIERLDRGELRVAEPHSTSSEVETSEAEKWKVNEWVKKAVLLYFPIRKMITMEAVRWNSTTRSP
jgi:2,3,4,5-tetrahydropyridine-2-carboxylate N-succinyltransferase